MVTLEKYELGSDEYGREVERENAYYLFEFICAIDNSMFLPKNIRKSLVKLIDELAETIGEEEITVSLKPRE